MNDRIKLAEAMFQRPKYAIDWMADFDPFTDANDDYAVLEWMRDDSRCMEFPRYVGALSDVMDKRLAASHAANYQIGDYARAALKVLEDKG